MNFSILFLCLGCVLSMDITWWKHTIIYEVFVWSFKDSNGDGIGDIKGITMMLDHFTGLGIDCIYLSPFYKSPMIDAGYDITNYTEIDPIFGTMADFEELVNETKKRGLKLIMDLIINHSSSKHVWFQKSIDGIPPYDDFYVWKDAKNHNSDGSPNPPNNWLCLFGNKSWEWNDKRKQFYYHKYDKNQPDLNLRNGILKKEIYKIMKFWLDKGIAGWRLDAARNYMEDKYFRDEPLKDGINIVSDSYSDYNHIYTRDFWESYQFIHELRKYVDKYSKRRNDFERIIMVELYEASVNNTMLYYGTKGYPIAQFPFNFNFISYYRKFENAKFFSNLMHRWLDNMPKGGTANWNVENHDTSRVATRLSTQYAEIMLITEMLAPGVAYIYYGQEIGMTDAKLRTDQIRDLIANKKTGVTRDGARSPMQWDDSINAGFTGNRVSWLPVNADYWKVNVETESKKENSRYNLFKTLSALRKTKTLKYGTFESHILSAWIFAFTRTLKGRDRYVVVHNLGSETDIVDLHLNIKNLSPVLEVVASSSNSGYRKGEQITSRPKFPKTFTMRPLSSIVLRTIDKL